MAPHDLRSTERFSSRVDNYVRFRPGYPQEVLSVLEQEIGFGTDWIVADVGSGTGISAGLFLKHGNVVIGVEPNLEMRSAAEQLLEGFSRFQSVTGTADNTTLGNQSVDLIVVAQAFHWFDPLNARTEFLRIVKPNGWVSLLWNLPRHYASPFLQDYQQLLIEYGIDYLKVRALTSQESTIEALYGGTEFRKFVLQNEQQFDLESLRGRLLSSSYAPTEDHANYEPMLEKLERIFEQHESDGVVRFEYDTEIFLGQLSA
ncbi:class I SAM-dependent methyltransferase [Bremerella sp. JC817]|uniref:class I SAM-dependent methyltransferase n=1 Tax=Bremerella sp. JC817 TaxID=3231756 RepID=UPI003457CBCE